MTLREELRVWRQKTAAGLSQPAFCVFGNKVLDEIVACRPVTSAQLGAIKGLGPTKLAQFLALR